MKTVLFFTFNNNNGHCSNNLKNSWLQTCFMLFRHVKKMLFQRMFSPAGSKTRGSDNLISPPLPKFPVQAVRDRCIFNSCSYLYFNIIRLGSLANHRCNDLLNGFNWIFGYHCSKMTFKMASIEESSKSETRPSLPS